MPYANLSFGAMFTVAQLVVGEADDLVLGDAILGEIAVALVLLLLHDLLRLESRVLPVPEDERRVVVVGRHGGLVDRAACTGCAGLHDGRPVRVRVGVGHERRGLLLLRVANAEVHDRKIVGPSWRAVGADLHAGWNAGRLRIDDDLARRAARNARERDEREHRVLGRAVGNSAQHRECRPAVGPREATIEAALAVERPHDVGLHVAKLNAVAEPVACVDGVREEFAGLVEGELGDIADVHRLAGGQVVEEQVRAFNARRSGGRAWSRRWRGRSALGGIRLHGEPSRLLARKGEAAHLVELLLLTRREVDEGDLVVARATLRLESLGFLRRGVHGEGREARRRRDDERSTGGNRRGARRSRHWRGELADLEAMLLALVRRTQHHFRVAIVRRELIGEPVAVVGEALRADALPRLDVGERQRARGRVRLLPARRGERREEQHGDEKNAF